MNPSRQLAPWVLLCFVLGMVLVGCGGPPPPAPVTEEQKKEMDKAMEKYKKKT